MKKVFLITGLLMLGFFLGVSVSKISSQSTEVESASRISGIEQSNVLLKKQASQLEEENRRLVEEYNVLIDDYNSLRDAVIEYAAYQYNAPPARSPVTCNTTNSYNLSYSTTTCY